MEGQAIATEATTLDEMSTPFVGRWNHLVSTTNWEKGRIIYQWREALVAEDAPAAEYSDEAWARRVGGVTGQHAGRLRRVYQRFGQVHEKYDGLYWSHFQAALDWDDAEMWLEGGVQNGWTVSEMRRKRWETLGAVEKARPRDEEIVTGETDEDFEPALNEPPVPATVSQRLEDVKPDPPQPARRENGKPADGKDRKDNRKATAERKDAGAEIFADEDNQTIKFVRPFENLSDLPADLADAFESFKLAILRHKADEWQQISRDDMLATLDALKELALAPSAEAAPF